MLKLTNELIGDYERFVFSIVNKYSNDSNRDDLMQAGMIGIMDASRKYDSSSNVKFTTFAYKYILGEVLSELRKDRNVKISRDIISDYRKIMIAKERLYKNFGRKITLEEISKIVGLTVKRINEVLRYSEKELSLNMNISDDENLTLEDTIYNKDGLATEDMINLRDAFDILSIDEKKLIYSRYFENKTQSEIAKENNMSQVKVYRYERLVLDKMKSKMS